MTQTCDAASILFNFGGHVVLSAGRSGDTRAVLVEPLEREGACPDCGVLSSRVQARPVHVVKDVQCGGAPLEVRVRAAAGVSGTGVSAAVLRADHR